MRKIQFNSNKLLLLLFILFNFYSCGPSNNEAQNDNFDKWSFAVVADPRDNTDSFRNALTEIRDMMSDTVQEHKPAEFLLIAGDIDPVVERYNDYKGIYSSNDSMNALFPVRGNHDYYDEIDSTYIIDTILPEQPNVMAWNNEDLNYYVTWKNIYLIVIDAYSDFGSGGCINSLGREWVRNIIESAPASIGHIFVSFHEPAFPRYRHLTDSFNACSDDRDAFWNMLIKYRDRVRAVFVGHTHSYYRIKVNDPAGDCANNTDCFPNDADGIYQIDAGAAGNGNSNIVVQVEINGEDVAFRVISALNGSYESFDVVDEWEI